MYIKNSVIEAIKSFKLIEGKLLFIKLDNKELFIDYNYIDKGVDPILYDFLDGLLYKKNHNLIYNDKIFENTSFLSKSLNREKKSIIIKSDTELDENDDFTVISNYSYFDFSKIKFLDRLKNIIHSLNLENFLFLGSSNGIHAYSLPSATPLWQFDMGCLGMYYDSFQSEEKPYQVSKFLGIWQNQLLVAVQEHKILAFNVDTGVIIRSWEAIDGLFFDADNKNLIPKSNSFILHNDKLVGVLHKFYFEIDMNTGKTYFKDLSDTMSENGILSIYPVLDNPLDNPHFYLTAMLKERDNGSDCLLSLNIETKKIEWKYIFENAALGVNRPQYSNGKLYQLDKNNTLHIFEKENT